MNTSIYVFSGTGTSLAIARKVAGGLGDPSIHSIPNRLKKTQGGEIVAETARIGLVFPCYFGSIPAIVLEFVRKLDYGNRLWCPAIIWPRGITMPFV
jgi:hypothetical protein